MVRPVRPSISWVSARGKAGSKNQCKPLKIRGSPKRTKASAAGATPVFHEISRAAGPKQQTTQTDRPPHCYHSNNLENGSTKRRPEADPQSAQDSFFHEGEPAAGRAEDARAVGKPQT